MRRVRFTVLILAFGLAGGCGGGGDARRSMTPPNVMEVVAQGLEYEAPARVASGWITFRFKNETDMTHFAVIERPPDGIGIAEQQSQVSPVFQKGMDLLNEGETEAAMAAFGGLPGWFHEVQFLGGPGFLGPKRTVETTVRLEPGTYLLECYVKTVGTFHSYNPDSATYGMIHEFEVVPRGAAPEPRSDITITLSSARGIEVKGEPQAGPQTVAVRFEDQKLYDNFVGHDVHLARLEEDTDLDELATWMDWRHPDGLEDPPPVEFLGGTHEMPAGSVAYFTVTLDPGRYAWVSEVPDPRGRGMLVPFTVPGGNAP